MIICPQVNKPCVRIHPCLCPVLTTKFYISRLLCMVVQTTATRFVHLVELLMTTADLRMLHIESVRGKRPGVSDLVNKWVKSGKYSNKNIYLKSTTICLLVDQPVSNNFEKRFQSTWAVWENIILYSLKKVLVHYFRKLPFKKICSFWICN